MRLAGRATTTTKTVAHTTKTKIIKSNMENMRERKKKNHILTQKKTKNLNKRRERENCRSFCSIYDSSFSHLKISFTRKVFNFFSFLLRKE